MSRSVGSGAAWPSTRCRLSSESTVPSLGAIRRSIGDAWIADTYADAG